MKVEAKPLHVSDVFKPLAITIAFESEKELAAFYSLFNHATLQKATVGETAAEKIKESLFLVHGKRPDYQKFHTAICSAMNF